MGVGEERSILRGGIVDGTGGGFPGAAVGGRALDFIGRRAGGALPEQARSAGGSEEARGRGELSAESDPAQIANLLVDCWEGAAMRSRLVRGPAPLEALLDASFRAVLAA